MTITIESTDRIIQLTTQAGTVPARLWEGRTASGIKVECLVTRIAAQAGEDLSQFDRELLEQRVPEFAESAFPAGSGAIPLRLIL